MNDVQERRKVGATLYVLQGLPIQRRWAIARYRRDWKRAAKTGFTTRWFLVDVEMCANERVARIRFSIVAPRRGNV